MQPASAAKPTTPASVLGVAGLGLAIFLLMSLGGLGLLLQPPAQRQPTAPGMVGSAVVLAFGLIGAAVSGGLMGGSRLAFLIAIPVLAILTVAFAFATIGMIFTGQASAALGSAILVCLTAGPWYLLNRAKTYFGVESLPWLMLVNALMGVLSLICPLLSIQLPFFGAWMSPWQVSVLYLLFAAGYLATAYGLHRHSPWTLQAATATAALSLFDSIAMFWDPNPQNKLGPGAAMSRTSVIVGTALCQGLFVWTWLRLRRQK